LPEIRRSDGVRVTVDGIELDLPDSQTILRALIEVGVDVPSLCDDPRLTPYGECRLCLVRVDGHPQPVAACATPLSPGMTIETHPDDLESVRRGILGMIASHYPAGVPETEPDEPLHRLLARYSVEATGGVGDPTRRDDSHPCIAVDMNRCIDCFRCVRICDEVQGQFAWQILGRGADTHVAPSGALTLVESPCVGCGACVDTCPTGALQDRTIVERGPPMNWTRTVCPYCGVGCELLVGTRADRIATVVPASDAPVNRGHACVKGRYAHGFVHASDRVTAPMLRTERGWRKVSWDEAVDAVAGGLRRIVERDGPSAVGVLGSARATNEDNYVLQKVARVALGTNNVDCCARVCHAPSATALRAALGTGAATNAFDDIEHAATILVCGANPTENHPVVGARIRQAVRQGAALIVVDPRRTELAAHATIHLRPEPGTDVLVFGALAATIVEERLVDEAFVAERARGYGEYVRSLGAFAPEHVATRCGVPAEDLRAAARLYATRRPAMAFHGLGITEHTQGTDGVAAIVNLAVLTGNLGRQGAGVNPLRGQNNVQGAAHMGCEPNFLTGFAPLGDAEHAARFATVWGAPLPDEPGLDAMEMLDAAASDALHALWVMGWDLLQTQPDMHRTDRALANLELLVVQDLFLNETAAAYATVFLPACSAYEKDGTFMNAERRVQRVRRAVAPLVGTRPDWEIVCAIATAMGHARGFTYGGAEEIWNEIRAVWPAGAGIAYSRLDGPGGLQWPCPSLDHPGTAVLHTPEHAADRPKIELLPVPYRQDPERTDDDFPIILVTGRVLDQFNAGTMTRRSLTQQLHATDRLQLAPVDAARHDISAGDPVEITSRYGSAVLVAEMTDTVAPGHVFATFSDPATHLNRVTGPHRDPTTHTPAYKRTAVSIRIAPNDS
jgi:formate dehydrogenase major subunit